MTTEEKLYKIEWVEKPFVMIGTERKYADTTDFVTKVERDRYVNLGWAKDCETGECGERKPGATAISVDNLKIKVGAKV